MSDFRLISRDMDFLIPPSVDEWLPQRHLARFVFSSRKLERETYDSEAFCVIAANQHPDHDTIATFRRRFLKQIDALFVQVLGVAREMGVLKLGTVALDGTKIPAAIPPVPLCNPATMMPGTSSGSTRRCGGRNPCQTPECRADP